MGNSTKPVPDRRDVAAADQFAPVLATAVYPLELFRRITGLETWALRKARRNGLRVVQVGRRRFVRGSDFLDYLDRQTDCESVGDNGKTH